MRERLMTGGVLKRMVRITPAYAGKTAFIAPFTFSLRDHPRVCGKDRARGAATLLEEGSPPRMRERLGNPGVAGNPGGITPAYAGKTKLSPVLQYRVQDHPRVCGKDIDHAQAKTLRLGSPPRMRERP